MAKVEKNLPNHLKRGGGWGSGGGGAGGGGVRTPPRDAEVCSQIHMSMYFHMGHDNSAPPSPLLATLYV